MNQLINLFKDNDDDKYHYHASFAHPRSLMSYFNKGYSLVGGMRATSKDIAYKGALIVGPSGSGKTSTVITGSIITLARGKASMCVMDISGEIYDLTSGYLQKKGYKIYCIDFSDISDTINFLALCKSTSDAMRVAFILISNSHLENKSDPYWVSSAEMMLVVFIEYLIFFAAPEFRNLANLVHLTDLYASNPRKLDLLFIRTQNAELIAKYKAMNNVGEKTLLSTLSTVRNALKVFSTPSVKKCTAKSTIDLSSFRREKSILYICTPLNQLAYLASFSALLFQAMFDEILKKIPAKDELDIFCLIDEMVQMRFQNLGMVFSNCRKYRAGCVGIVQDEKMLEMAFSPAEAHAIRTNCYSKVYLPGQPLSTCKQLEELLGKFTYVDSHGAERTRQLMSAAEIRMLSEDKALIIPGPRMPILATTWPHYKHWWFSRLTRIPPYNPSRELITEPLLIPIPDEA